MKKIVFILTLSFSFLSFSANDEFIESMKKQLNNPRTTPEQRAQIKKFIDVHQQNQKAGDDYDASIKPGQKFKSGKKWYKYFRFKFKRMNAEMGKKAGEEEKIRRSTRDKSYDEFDNAGDELNLKFVNELLATGYFHFDDQRKRRYQVDNKHRPYSWTVMNLLIDHINIRVMQYKYEQAKKEDPNKAMVAGIMMKQNKVFAHVLSAQAFNHINKSIKEYLTQYAKLELSMEKKKYQAGLTYGDNVSNFVKGMTRISKPPNTSNFYQNWIRDYYGHILILDGVTKANEKSKEYQKTSFDMKRKVINDQTKVRFKHIKELYKTAQLVTKDSELEGKTKKYEDLVMAFRTKSRGHAQDMEDEAKRLRPDGHALNKIKEKHREELYQWANDYLDNVEPLKKRPNVNNALRSWYGKFTADY